MGDAGVVFRIFVSHDLLVWWWLQLGCCMILASLGNERDDARLLQVAQVLQRHSHGAQACESYIHRVHILGVSFQTLPHATVHLRVNGAAEVLHVIACPGYAQQGSETDFLVGLKRAKLQQACQGLHVFPWNLRDGVAVHVHADTVQQGQARHQL